MFSLINGKCLETELIVAIPVLQMACFSTQLFAGTIVVIRTVRNHKLKPDLQNIARPVSVANDEL